MHKGLCSELQTCACRFEYYVHGLSRPCRSGSCCTLFSWLHFTWKRSILDFEGFLRSMFFYSKPFTIDSTLETRSLRLIVEQTRYFYSRFIASNNTWLVYFGRLGVINIAGLLALYRDILRGRVLPSISLRRRTTCDKCAHVSLLHVTATCSQTFYEIICLVVFFFGVCRYWRILDVVETRVVGI